MSYRSCSFTGHRELGFDIDEENLEYIIRRLIEEGCDRFYCGMAYGFDLLCCSILVKLKKEYSFSIIACVPYKNQAADFCKEDKKLYSDLLKKCDERVILHDFYVKGCMFERDRYMVDRSDVVINYLRKDKGGTFYTVKYALSKGIPLIDV